MKKTAVEWLYQRILAKDIKAVFEQAKEMEKEQIKNAWLNSLTRHYKGDYNSADEYYNETYKNTEQ